MRPTFTISLLPCFLCNGVRQFCQTLFREIRLAPSVLVLSVAREILTIGGFDGAAHVRLACSVDQGVCMARACDPGVGHGADPGAASRAACIPDGAGMCGFDRRAKVATVLQGRSAAAHERGLCVRRATVATPGARGVPHS